MSIIDTNKLTKQQQISILKFDYTKNKDVLDKLFGETFFTFNQIKTWEDILNIFDIFDDQILIKYPTESICIPKDVIKSVIAYIKLKILIELAYFGNVTDNEFSVFDRERFWGIVCDEHTHELVVTPIDGVKSFPAFHNENLAREFMKYPSNKKLLEDYFAS